MGKRGGIKLEHPASMHCPGPHQDNQDLKSWNGYNRWGGVGWGGVGWGGVGWGGVGWGGTELEHTASTHCPHPSLLVPTAVARVLLGPKATTWLYGQSSAFSSPYPHAPLTRPPPFAAPGACSGNRRSAPMPGVGSHGLKLCCHSSALNDCEGGPHG